MIDDPTVAGCDPEDDAAALAAIGAQVAARLDADPRVLQVDHAGVQMYVHPGFLSLQECAGLVEMIDRAAVPSTLYQGNGQAGFRTSYSCHLNPWDALVARVEARISEVLGIANGCAETMQGQRYLVGQEFKAHHDFFHPGQDYWEREKLAGGQRTWTAMIFLNEPEAGGNTEFPELGIGVRPQPGKMLIWNNLNPDGTLNYKTLHTGTPVMAGAKHIITKWYRQHDWVQLNSPKA